VSFIAKPTATLEAYMEPWFSARAHKDSYRLGRLAMGLEIITQIRCLEEISVMGDEAREAAVSALHTLLRDCGIADAAYETYERLLTWRTPKFVVEQLGPSPSATSDAGASEQLQHQRRTSGPSSLPDAPEAAASHANKPPASQPERRDP
jgi:hypothetical protein